MSRSSSSSRLRLTSHLWTASNFIWSNCLSGSCSEVASSAEKIRSNSKLRRRIPDVVLSSGLTPEPTASSAEGVTSQSSTSQSSSHRPSEFPRSATQVCVQPPPGLPQTQPQQAQRRNRRKTSTIRTRDQHDQLSQRRCLQDQQEVTQQRSRKLSNSFLSAVQVAKYVIQFLSDSYHKKNNCPRSSVLKARFESDSLKSSTKSPSMSHTSGNDNQAHSHDESDPQILACNFGCCVSVSQHTGWWIKRTHLCSEFQCLGTQMSVARSSGFAKIMADSLTRFRRCSTSSTLTTSQQITQWSSLRKIIKKKRSG